MFCFVLKINVDDPHGSLINNQMLEQFPLTNRCENESIIQWVPPIPNWNAWIGSNIDEGPLARLTMETISQDLKQRETFKNQYQNHDEQRQQLPVFHSKQFILNQIQTNKIILVRGATGSGKTTQVSHFLFQNSNS